MKYAEFYWLIKHSHNKRKKTRDKKKLLRVEMEGGAVVGPDCSDARYGLFKVRAYI